MSDAPQYPPPGDYPQYPPPGGNPQYPPPGGYPQYPSGGGYPQYPPPGGYPQYPSGGGFSGFPSSAGGLANYGQRIGASLIDGVILFVVSVICDVAAGSIGGRILSVVIGLAYSLILIGRFGTTVGNMAVGTKVVTVDGGPPGYAKAGIRYLVEAVLFIALIVPGILDLLWPLWDGQNQTLHDKAAGTLVVQSR